MKAHDRHLQSVAHAEAERKSLFARVFRAIGAFCSWIVLTVRLFFFDRLVRQAASALDALARMARRRDELSSEEAQREAQQIRRSRLRAWAVLLAALVAGTADLFCVLPNIGYALASRFAGGETPSAWQTVSAFLIIEVALIMLLLIVKSLANTQPHLDELRTTEDDLVYASAKRKLLGARVALVSYIALVTFAFSITVAGECGKLAFARNMVQLLRGSNPADSGEVLQRDATPGGSATEPAAESQGFNVPIIAGVLVIIWGLHVCILFMKGGEFGRRGVCEYTRSEAERREGKLTRKCDAVLLRINRKLKASSATYRRAMEDNTPAAVRAALSKLMDSAAGRPGEEGSAGAAPIPAGPAPAPQGFAAPLNGLTAAAPSQVLPAIFVPLETAGEQDDAILFGDFQAPKNKAAV
jgi:hypothetical protein